MWKILTTLNPKLGIPQRFLDLWREREIKYFKTSSTLYFLFFFIAYIFHYFYIDIPLKKQPIADWQVYRFSCAGIALMGLGLNCFRFFSTSKYYRFPLILSGLYFTYFQGVSMVWRESIPYYFIIAIPIITAIVATSSILGSIVYMSLAFLVGSKGIYARDYLLHEIYSTYFVSLIFLISIKTNSIASVRSFIHEMLHIEAEMKKVRVEQEKSKEIEKITKQVSHDLQVPISTLGMVFSYLEGEEKDLAEKSLERLRLILSDLDRIREEQTIEYINLNSLVKEVISNFKDKNVVFELNISPDSHIVANKNHIERIFINLIKNSIEANSSFVEFVSKNSESGNSLVLRDNGSGIPKKIITKVFREGFTFGKSNGTGIGLSHALEKLNEFGIKVKIESEVNKGTDIILYWE